MIYHRSAAVFLQGNLRYVSARILHANRKVYPIATVVRYYLLSVIVLNRSWVAAAGLSQKRVASFLLAINGVSSITFSRNINTSAREAAVCGSPQNS